MSLSDTSGGRYIWDKFNLLIYNCIYKLCSCTSSLLHDVGKCLIFVFWGRQSITLLFYPIFFIEERHYTVGTCKYGGETVLYVEAIER